MGRKMFYIAPPEDVFSLEKYPWKVKKDLHVWSDTALNVKSDMPEFHYKSEYGDGGAFPSIRFQSKSFVHITVTFNWIFMTSW